MVTAPTIRILADVLTRHDQAFRGAVLIGDNGVKGALYEYYLALLTSIDPLKPLPILANPIMARTLVSIDPSISFIGTVDDTVKNTHALYSAAITHLAPGDLGFVAPAIEITKEVGKLAPLFSINLLTMQSTNSAAYIGSIKLNGEINTFMDQNYRTNTLTADPISPLNTVTFQVDDINAKISFDLYKNVLTNETMLTNTEGLDGLILNGPTTFNGLKTTPTFPTGKWSSVTMGMSLAALAASRMGGPAEPGKPSNEVAKTVDVPKVIPQLPQIAPIDRNRANAGAMMAAIMNNNNFEIPKMMPDGSVFVSMGSPAKPSSASDGGRDERFNQKDFYDLDESIDVVKDDKLGAKAKDDASCGKDGANCDNN
jgi:hypothetical protein